MASAAQSACDNAADSSSRFEMGVLWRALSQAVWKLNPAYLRRRRTLLIAEIAALVATFAFGKDLLERSPGYGFDLAVLLLLWAATLAATFAESFAESRGKAHADRLRRARGEVMARRLSGNKTEIVSASRLLPDDVVIVEAGELIPADGQIVDGIATVDESVITGESAPVIRESGRELSQVSAGTRVLSDRLEIRVISAPGETLLDKMAKSIEGLDRRRTPKEIAAGRLVAGLALGAICSVVVLAPFVFYVLMDRELSALAVFAGLVVCLIPLTIASMLPVIGLAGLDRVMRSGVLVPDRAALEASAAIDVALLDKTGTITVGNREAVEFIPLGDVSGRELAEAAFLSSFADETPEGRSIVALAHSSYGVQPEDVNSETGHVIPFSAYTRMSGVDTSRCVLRKGATAAIQGFVLSRGGTIPAGYEAKAEAISRAGGTPLGVADGPRLLGIVALKDVMKPGITDRIQLFRSMGIKPVMITGDNPITAAAIAREAGFDDFIAQATPADKLAYIKREQEQGRRVAMTGDGTNDAPALAQADVGLAMASGTQAAKEAANMVDLDSNATKLIEVIRIARQMDLTRAALSSFSIASSIAKYVLLISVILPEDYPALARFKLVPLHSLPAALLCTLVFSLLCMLAMFPSALGGIHYRSGLPIRWLNRYRLFYGAAGLVLPFPFIWAGERILVALHHR